MDTVRSYDIFILLNVTWKWGNTSWRGKVSRSTKNFSSLSHEIFRINLHFKHYQGWDEVKIWLEVICQKKWMGLGIQSLLNANRSTTSFQFWGKEMMEGIYVWWSTVCSIRYWSSHCFVAAEGWLHVLALAAHFAFLPCLQWTAVAVRLLKLIIFSETLR